MTQLFPIDAIKQQFIAALEHENTLILTAPPGAGKSTRLPLWLLALAQYQNKKIYLLQPRRVAAKNIACYLSKKIGEPVGQSIGYRLRNESKVSSSTRLEVITEGILTQIIQHDPELNDCGLIIFDEFHERSLHGDLAFALARDVQQALREDLRLVIMSATLAVKTLSEKLPDAIMLASEGRSYPVEIEYFPVATSKRLQQNYVMAKQWREHALKVITHQVAEHSGSILVFLPGVADIKYLCQNLIESLLSSSYISPIQLCPLYGELSLNEQQKAIAPSKDGERKLVLATNIAETSLTIEGVTLVIDCGFEKTAVYDPKSLTNKLHEQVISKASATQRAGRAGRLSAGKCLRLYSSEEYSRRDESSKSEIQQADLLPFVIEAARWGVTQLSELPLIELPAKVKENQAWQELRSLSIVSEQNQLTSHGEIVAAVASHPRFSHMMVMAQSLEEKYKVRGLFSLACLVAAMLEERDVFTREQGRYNCHLGHRIDSLLNEKIRGHVSHQLFKQANQLARSLANPKTKHIDLKGRIQLPVNYIGVLLALAYPERLAKYRDSSSNKTGEYVTTAGKGISINDEDAMLGESYIVAAQVSEVNLRARQGRISQKGMMVQLAAPVDIEKLIDWNIVKIVTDVECTYNNKVDRITANKLTKINALVIDESPSPEKLTNELVAQLWMKELTKNGLSFLNFKDKDQALLLRWRWLNLHSKDLALPEIDDTSLLANIETWFLPFVGEVKSKKQLDKCDFSDMFLSLLTYQQQQTLAKAAPEYFIGPTKRQCAIRYTTDKMPIVSMPMQELYGLTQTPCIGNVNEGDSSGIPLILEILSPAKRPIQVTQDLAAFWQGSYKAVQKDMKSQYPRHFWPDDPANAKATRKTKKHMMKE